MAGNNKRRGSNVVKIRIFRGQMFMVYIILIVFAVVIAISLINAMKKPKLAIYDISSTEMFIGDNYKTALIIRSEEDVNASQDGFVRYFAGSGTRAKVGDSIFSMSDRSDIISDDTLKDNSTFSEASLSKLTTLIEKYEKNEASYDFYEVYDVKEDFESEIVTLSMNESFDMQSKLVGNSDGSLYTYYALNSGIVSYDVDTFDGISLDTFTSATFTRTGVNVESVRTNRRQYKTGDKIFKMVTSDTWYLVFPITDEQYQQYYYDKNAIKSPKTIDFRIEDDNLYISAPYEVITRDGENFIVITMYNYIANYLDHRFLEIAIGDMNQNTLKIPATSLVKKRYYQIPENYVVTKKEAEDAGAYIDDVQLSIFKNGNAVNLSDKAKGVIHHVITTEGVVTDSFYPINALFNDDDYYYSEYFEELGNSFVILEPENLTEYIPSVTEIEGVYNVNKGYASFRRIERVKSNGEYILIRDDSVGGPRLNDHIGLVGNLFEENKIIY